MEHARDDDRFLNDMIAAEALFGDSSEITFKLSLRAAYKLEPHDAHKRRKIFEDMKRAYEVRSKIVHGSRLQANKLRIAGVAVPLDAFVERIEDYIRQATRAAVISTSGKYAPRWDDDIVGPLPADAD
jgi:hypothetical protein